MCTFSIQNKRRVDLVYETPAIVGYKVQCTQPYSTSTELIFKT